MKYIIRIMAMRVVPATLLFAAAVGAQETYRKDMPDSLAKRAKVTEAVAAATAHGRLPKGKIQGVELEVENGKLMYSYDVKTDGKSGIDEVNVDALTGKIIGFAHESPATEKKETAEDANTAKAVKTKPPTKP
jgi:hypothetical protein